MNGILIVNKPKDYTSRDVVNCVSKLLHTKKVGHTGTLDPLATGVLVLCIGEYTKFVSKITSHDKQYVATIQFGIETDTLDITGKILSSNQTFPSKETLERVCKQFIGKQNQEVPLYSAKKINGKKLYEYAREGKDVTLPKQEIEIYDLKVIEYHEGEVVLSCHVSKGTYIRSLIRDICKTCHVLGTMKRLERSSLGEFSLSNAVQLEDIEQGHYELLTYRDLFDYETYELNEHEYFLVCHGNELFMNDLCLYMLLTYHGQEIAFYEKKGKSYRPLLRFDSEEKTR